MDLFNDVPNGVDKITIRKKMNKMLAEARKKAKPTKCMICGKNQTSFCNSHSVPEMFLKEISENGMLLHATASIGMDFEIVDLEDGIKRSGTFHNICNECDNSFFQDYENPDNIVVKPTDKMLAEIAVKNILIQLDKREIEKQLIEVQQEQYNLYVNPEGGINLKELDIKEYEAEFELHKTISVDNRKGEYQILFWDVLPYCVPIAMQSAIAMPKDMYGEQINDVFDFSKTTRMQYMHMAILPLKNESVILAFYHKRDKLYRNLRHQINSSSKEQILEFLNYVIFAYTENYFISKRIQQTIETNENLRKLSQENNEYPELGMLGINNMFGIGYKPITRDEIPNFLSEEWAIKREKVEK